MSKIKYFPISGAGGGGKGGGGGGSTGVEQPDSLRSLAHASGIDLICEGPVKGLVNGKGSIYLDDTSLLDIYGNENFKGITVITDRLGTQNQEYIPGIPSIESTTPVGQEIKYGNPITQTIQDVNTDFVRILIDIPALYSINPGSGDNSGTTVELAIEVRPSGGSYRMLEGSYDFVNATNMGGGIYRTQLLATGFSIDVGGEVYWQDPLSDSYVRYQIQYRLVGAVDWSLYAEVELWPDDMTREQWNDESGNPYNTNRYTRTYSVLGLPEGQYEVRSVKIAGAGSVSTNYVKGYSPLFKLVIAGKSSSKYERSYPIKVKNEGTGPWDIKITRLTADSGSSYLQNQTWWNGYTKVQEEKLSFPNSCLMGWSVSSEQFSSIPARTYDMFLKIIQVPTNYDPDSRIYTGNWDGTFKAAWSNNPAWCFYDLLTNSRYGLGDLLDSSLVDKWALYTIGQYCDGLVPSGLKDQTGNDILEPRFTMNCLLQTRGKAYEVLGNLASVFRGMAYWVAGTITAVQDAPSDPVMALTASNVIGGTFSYQGSGKKARHTVALVGWNDPSNFYKQSVEYVEDLEGILRYGVNTIDLTAFGCTSRGQAHRIGKWLLYTEHYETEVVSFRVGLDSVYLRPGDIVLINDPNKSGVRMGGRILSATTSVVTIDSPIVIEVGETYTLTCIMPDGTLETRNITNPPGTVSALTVSVGFSVSPNQNSVWLVSASNVEPRKFRVLGISEQSKANFDILAVAHDPNKYSYVETGNKLEFLPYNIYPDLSVVLPPVNLSLIQESYSSGPNINSYRLAISWEKSPSPYVVSYKCEYRKAESNWIIISGEDDSFHRDVDNLTVATYEVRVSAKNSAGISSGYLADSITLISILGTPPDVTGLVLQTASWDGLDCYIKWNSIITTIYPATVHRRYKIEIYDVGMVLKRTDYSEDTKYIYTYGKNYDDNAGVPIPSVVFRVYGENWVGVFSVNYAQLSPTNPAPSVPSVAYVYKDKDCVLTWTPVLDSDFDETWVRVYLEGGRINLRRTAHVSGNTYIYAFSENEADYPGHGNPWSVYFRITHFDKFGQSNSYDLTVMNDQPDIPTFVNIQPGFQQAMLTWTPPANEDWDIVEAWRSSTNDRDTATRVYSGRSIMMIDTPLASLDTYYYWLRSKDTSGNYSDWESTRYNGHSVTPYQLSGDDFDLGDLNLETIDIVSTLPTLPNVDYPELSMVLLTTDHKLYRNRNEVWTVEVDGGDIAASTITGDKIIAGEINAGHIHANVITGDHLVVDSAVITQSIQIANAIVEDAHIVDVTADKITAGIIDVLVGLGAGNILLDAPNDQIVIKDAQNPNPITRVELGKIGVADTDYGLKLYDMNGQVTLEASDTLKQKYMKLDSLEVLRVHSPIGFPFSNGIDNGSWYAQSSCGEYCIGSKFTFATLYGAVIGARGETRTDLTPLWTAPSAIQRAAVCGHYAYDRIQFLVYTLGNGLYFGSSTDNGVGWTVYVTPVQISVNGGVPRFGWFENANLTIVWQGDGTNQVVTMRINNNTGAVLRSEVVAKDFAGTSIDIIGSCAGADIGYTHILIRILFTSEVRLLKVNSSGVLVSETSLGIIGTIAYQMNAVAVVIDSVGTNSRWIIYNRYSNLQCKVYIIDEVGNIIVIAEIVSEFFPTYSGNPLTPYKMYNGAQTYGKMIPYLGIGRERASSSSRYYSQGLFRYTKVTNNNLANSLSQIGI